MTVDSVPELLVPDRPDSSLFSFFLKKRRNFIWVSVSPPVTEDLLAAVSGADCAGIQQDASMATEIRQLTSMSL